MLDGDSSVTHLYDDLGRERVSVRVSRRADQVVAEVLDGLDHLSEGWRLTWATGPFGAPDRTHGRSGARTARARPRPRDEGTGADWSSLP